MRKFTLLVVLLVVLDVRAQFNHLQTQYIYNPFVLNPAIAGEQGYMSTTLSYRRQWMGFTGAPETFAFTLETPVKNRNHNLGLAAVSDRIGVVNQSAFSLAYAYRILAGKYFFSAGLAPQMICTRASWNDIVTNQQDAVFTNPQQEVNFGVGFGIYFHSEHIFAGISGKGINQSGSVIGLKNQPFHFYAGVKGGNREKISFLFSTLIRYLAPSWCQFDVNTNLMFRNKLGVGCTYRWKESVAGLLSVKLNEQFLLGYSYDFPIAALSRYNSGSHEIMLRYEFSYTLHSNSPR